jgi:hypothetical protein
MLQGDNEMSVGLLILIIALWIFVVSPAIFYLTTIADDWFEAMMLSVSCNAFLALMIFIIFIIIKTWKVPA